MFEKLVHILSWGLGPTLPHVVAANRSMSHSGLRMWNGGGRVKEAKDTWGNHRATSRRRRHEEDMTCSSLCGISPVLPAH